MTQEEKQLLLKDLCMRIPYHTLVCLNPGTYNKPSVHRLTGVDEPYEVYLNIDSEPYNIEYIKPYLRPISSMTEEERKELRQISEEYLDDWSTADSNLLKWNLDAKVSSMRATFYNSHHLDWNGLIEKSLAIVAPEGMYKTE